MKRVNWLGVLVVLEIVATFVAIFYFLGPGRT